MIRNMYQLYQNNQGEYRQRLKEAEQLIKSISIEDAFFDYVKAKTTLSKEILIRSLQRASDYCHLKQPLLGMTDINEVQTIQQKVAQGKLLLFRYGKDTQNIRNATRLYYAFTKVYRERKAFKLLQEANDSAESEDADQLSNGKECSGSVNSTVETISRGKDADIEINTINNSQKTSDESNSYFEVDFYGDGTYYFTKPVSYTYKGAEYSVKSWNRLYVEVCGLFFTDYHDLFMTIMNGDVPGYSALTFADDQHKNNMRVPKSFAPGYYLEANADATTIVRRIAGLYKLFGLNDHDLRIAYRKIQDNSDDQTEEEWILAQIKRKQLKYHDNRDVNGCLWIVGNHDLDEFVKNCALKGYSFTYKNDGCKVFPETPVWWTKDFEKKKEKVRSSEFRNKLDGGFKDYLLSIKGFAPRTAIQYSQCVDAVEQYIINRGLDYTFDTEDAEQAQWTYDVLMNDNDFIIMNDRRHHQYSAALLQYLSFLRADKTAYVGNSANKATIKDVTIQVLQESGEPLTMTEIMQRIAEKQLYTFNSNNPSLILYQGIRRFCKGMNAPNHSPIDYFERFTDEHGLVRYTIIGNLKDEVKDNTEETAISIDERWLLILQESFPDGYILNDFLGQFQAAAFWQERYGEECPIQGEAIDAAMKAVGTVRDGRVFIKSEEDKQLIATICTEIIDILSDYTTVYRSCIYDRYQEQLASISIYTEPVMTQQLLAEAKGSFFSVNQVFAKRGQFTSVAQDARKVLREHGGPMPVEEIAKVLWFIPRDMVYHYLSVDDESLNIGNSTWMLAEHFPVTRDDADRIGHMLDEYFLTNNYVQAFDLVPLLRDHLPAIADNMSGMTYQAIFNIVQYYLRERFNFTKAIISPKGTSIDFTDLFRAFAAERDTFTLTDLEALASELKLPIYWESTYAGGAVRVSKTEFVNKRLIQFDVDAIDAALADFCPGDYLPLMSVSSAMMMHLPSCGYRWNGYLLQSYVFGFSKVFRLARI